MATRNVAVSLTANISQYRAAMAQASAATKGMATDSMTSFQRVGARMQSVGGSMTKFVTLPLIGVGAGAVKAAMDWETAWAGVTKTVDGTAEQMSTLEQGLRDMAKELPATHGEIAAVAEAAGQLGVGVEDIEAFTRVMIDLGETTNLSADEAATALARFMNIMGTSQSEVSNLGSTIVDLGNNSATTESEIVNMSTRLAAAGRQAGLSETDVLAFSAALTSVGVNAEAGGTAFSKLFATINTAVIDGGEKLETFAQVAGVSAEGFRAAFEEDAAGAIAMFIEGIGEMAARGESTTGVLQALGLGNERTMRAVLSLGQAEGLLTDALDLSANAWEENTALSEEAEKRYATTAAQFEMVRNKVVDLGISLGQVLLPAVGSVVDAIGGLVEIFQGLPGPVQGAIGGFLGLVAVAGPMLFVTGSLIKNFTLVSGALTGLTGPAAAVAGVLGAVAVVAGTAFVAWKILGGGHLNASADINVAADALIRSTDAALAEATAAGVAATEVDTLAIAHTALSIAIAETADNELSASFARFNVAAADTLGVLIGLRSEGFGGELNTSIQLLADGLGITTDQAAKLRTEMLEVDWADTTAVDNLAARYSVTSDELRSASDAMFTLTQFAVENQHQINDLALAHLDVQAGLGGTAREALLAAEEIEGSRYEADNAIPVYNEFVNQLVAMSLAERDAAGATRYHTTATEAATAVLAELGIEGVAAAGVLDHLNFVIESGSGSDAQAFWEGLALTLKFTAEQAEMVALGVRHVQEFGADAIDAHAWEAWAAAVGLAPDVLKSTVMQLVALQEAAEAPAVDALPSKLEMAAGGAKELSGNLAPVSDALVDVAEAMEAADRAFNANWINQLRELTGLQAPTDGWMSVLGVDDLNRFGEALHMVLDPQQNFIRSQDAIWQNAIDLQTAFAEWQAAVEEATAAGEDATEVAGEWNTSLEQNTEEGLRNRGMLFDWMDAILDGADAQLAAGDSIDDVTNTLEYNKEAMIRAAVAAGFNEDQVRALVDQYMNVPESVSTAIKISGEMYALNRIEELLEELDNIPPHVVTEMEAILQTEGAWAAYHYLFNTVNGSSPMMRVRVAVPTWRFTSDGAVSPGGTRYFARGGFVNQPIVGMIGEAGPEAVLPLGNQSDLTSVLGHPQVFGPVVDALGKLVPASAMTPLGGGETRGGDINVTVHNNGRDITGEDIARAIQRHRVAA
jgi:TP901 family phage tail tape measure protein